MAELAAEGPFEGLGLPLAAGGAALAARPAVARAAVAPFAGRRAAVSETLAARIGAGLPEAGRAAAGGVAWAGMGQWLVEGQAADELAGWLAGLAAVTDQTDGWAAMALGGQAAREVLARLVPLDLDPVRFPPGAAARSLMRHVPLLILVGADGFELFVPRSLARTAAQELAAAMRSVAARALLA